MIVVSDTSPLLNLARIGRLQLLEQLYHKVLIPSAVNHELLSQASVLPILDFASIPWLIVADAQNRNRVSELRSDLDEGEAEAIVLAIERHADLLLVDERRGRRTATAAGLKITGLLGVLVASKRAGLIPQVKPILDDLIQTARFWVGPTLYARLLEELGEADVRADV